MTRTEVVTWARREALHYARGEWMRDGYESAANLLEAAPDPRLKELAAWLAEKAAWYKVRAANSRSAHGVRETYRIDAERADAIATMLRGGS